MNDLPFPCRVYVDPRGDIFDLQECVGGGGG